MSRFRQNSLALANEYAACGCYAESLALLQRLPDDEQTLSPMVFYFLAFFAEKLGRETVFVRSGGSIPIVGEFAKYLGIPTILMGFGLPDDGLHSPNEKYRLSNYYQGIETIAEFLKQYGAAS